MTATPLVSGRDAQGSVVPARLALIGAASAAVWFFLLHSYSYHLAGGIDYPLDDVYIHLSIAKVIAAGGYGVVPGEPSSAGSSVLYPLLLMPFAGTEAQRLLPLFWNALAMLGLGAVWGLACGEIAARRAGLALAVFGPLGLYMAGLGFLGMENALHALLALLCLFGLRHWLQRGRLAPWFVAALILAPLTRFEGIGLTLLCLAVIAFTGGLSRACALLAAVFAPLIAFGAYLISLGLSPVPGSVQVKMSEAHDAKPGLDGFLSALRFNFSQDIGLGLGFFALCALWMAWRGRQDRAASLVLAVAALATLAHLMVGRIGWLARYEAYVVILLATGLALGWDALRRAGARAPLGGGLIVGLLVALRFLNTAPGLAQQTLQGPTGIRAQQGEMARFVRDHLQAPIAVNDLGYVAWQARDFVLDLWGLGSPEAMALRLSGAENWIGPLAARKGVQHAMIYDEWLGPQMPADWLRLGLLHYTGPPSTPFGSEVAFYAHPAADAAMRRAIEAWTPDLPAHATFTFGAEASR